MSSVNQPRLRQTVDLAQLSAVQRNDVIDATLFSEVVYGRAGVDRLNVRVPISRDDAAAFLTQSISAGKTELLLSRWDIVGLRQFDAENGIVVARSKVDPNTFLLVLAGTNSISDLISNAAIVQAGDPLTGQRDFASLMNGVALEGRIPKEAKIILAGHSAGEARAMSLALEMYVNLYDISMIVGVGGPGNPRGEYRIFDSVKINVIDELDPVTWINPRYGRTIQLNNNPAEPAHRLFANHRVAGYGNAVLDRVSGLISQADRNKLSNYGDSALIS